MASAPPERRSKLRLFLDATILIRAVSFPRLPFEILRLGLAGEVGIVLSPLVIESARRHVERLYPGRLPLLEQVLEQLQYESVPDPDAERVDQHRDLCRDESDIPVILAAADARVDYLVTSRHGLLALPQFW
jgi:predicted nucleic acid-binding protein